MQQHVKVYEQQMSKGYNRDDLQGLLRTIHAYAPSVLYVSTEAGGRAGNMSATLAKSNRRQRVDLGPTSGRMSTGGQSALGLFLGVPPGKAEELGQLLRELYALNPNGSWVLEEQPVAAAVGSGSPFTQALAESLADNLPEIAQIHVTTFQQGQGSGHERTRTFISFVDHDGRERAALDGAFLSKHVEAYAAPAGEHTRVNQARVRAWAEQLGADEADMVFALHDLHGLCNQARITTADLPSRQVAW